MFSCALGYKPDFTPEGSVARLAPQPRELTGVPATTGCSTQPSKECDLLWLCHISQPSCHHRAPERHRCPFSGNWTIHQFPGQQNSSSYFVNCTNTMHIVYSEISDTWFVITQVWKPKLQLFNLGTESFPKVPDVHGSGCGSMFLFLLSIKRPQTENFD